MPGWIVLSDAHHADDVSDGIVSTTAEPDDCGRLWGLCGGILLSDAYHANGMPDRLVLDDGQCIK